MFVKGETPIVLSYVTSSAYHKIVEGEKKYKAAVFEEGHYTQIEFAAMVKKSKKQKLAQTFIDFMLSEDISKGYSYKQLDVSCYHLRKTPFCFFMELFFHQLKQPSPI